MPTPEKFEGTKRKAEEIYKSIGEVYCPYFKEKVAFHAPGLEHIKFKDRNKTRLASDQYMRFRLLHLAPTVIKLSHTLQGISRRKNFERQKTHARWEILLKNTTYYEFVAIIENVRVRVIVKQIEDGPKFFWSIIPFWKINERKERKMHNGNPEAD